MKFYLLLTSIAILGMSGCTSPSQHLNTPAKKRAIVTMHYENPTPQKLALYQQTMRTVASGIKDDSRYQRIALDTPEKKEWFKRLTYRLWDRQMTRYQFMTEGLAKYPSRRYEFQFVINGFAKVCG